MATDANLKEIRRKVYMSSFQDGLWDIFLGVCVVGWGVSMFTDLAYLAGVFFIGAYLAVFGIKRWLTYPRIGYVRFSATRVREIKGRFFILLTVMALLGVGVGVLWGIGPRPQWL